MLRTHAISQMIYDYLYPSPRPEDPVSFTAHLTENLVPEVRIETATFYGSLDSVEARYPGLSYSYRPHRKRLGRFPHHARLFRAFDALGITDSEIASFCRWEGTLWARQRFEKDECVKVSDTTGEEIKPWFDPRVRRSQTRRTNQQDHESRRRYVEEVGRQEQRRLETTIDPSFLHHTHHRPSSYLIHPPHRTQHLPQLQPHYQTVQYIPGQHWQRPQAWQSAQRGIHQVDDQAIKVQTDIAIDIRRNNT